MSRKEGRLNLRIDPALQARAHACAKAQCVSLSSVVEALLRAYVAETEAAAAPVDAEQI